MSRTRHYARLAIQHSDITERVLLIFVFSCIAILGGLYMYLVANAAYATADRKEFASESISLEGEIAHLEERYLGVKSSVTLDGAYERGLADMHDVAYVALGERANGLSLEVR